MSQSLNSIKQMAGIIFRTYNELYNALSGQKEVSCYF